MLDVPPDPSADVTHAVLELTALSILFAAKHLVADFLVQTTWMARGKERPVGWFVPLLAHVLCHAAMTLIIVLALVPRLWWLALVDFGIHFVVDRTKTAVAQRGAWTVDQPAFWWLLGSDQFLHQVTNVALAAALVLL